MHTRLYGNGHRTAVLYFYPFGFGLQFGPTRFGLVGFGRIRFGFFLIKINVVVFKHGEAVGIISVVPQQRIRNARHIIAIHFMFWRNDMRLIPGARLRKPNVWIVRKNHFMLLRFGSTNHPAVAPNEGRNWTIFKQLCQGCGNGRIIGGGCFGAFDLHSIPLAFNSKISQIGWAPLVSDVRQQRICFLRHRKAKRHKSQHVVHVFQSKRFFF